MRGRAGLDFRHGGLSVRPEVLVAHAQRDTFLFESPTAGYAVFNVKGSYTTVRPHGIHVISAELFNAGDRVYRNHVSFVKDQGPEIGRGLRVSYAVRYF
jgi:iron complex outermembrane receptor protein